jgi:pyruvate dehydrogenase E1 component beta subunit
MFGGQFDVPLVIRTNGGSQAGKAAQHSQSLETLFGHVPGLEVVVPGSPDDAYGLLRSAVRSPNPTIFLEHKSLYAQRGPVRRQEVPIGVADVVRAGTDVTVVATQLLRARALEAAERLAGEGISVEVVDPRTLAPLDAGTIVASVERTRRLVVAHEAPALYGYAGELVARVVERLWGRLAAPPLRVCGAHAPVAYSQVLEEALVPTTAELAAAIRELVTGTGRS